MAQTEDTDESIPLSLQIFRRSVLSLGRRRCRFEYFVILPQFELGNRLADTTRQQNVSRYRLLWHVPKPNHDPPITIAQKTCAGRNPSHDPPVANPCDYLRANRVAVTAGP